MQRGWKRSTDSISSILGSIPSITIHVYHNFGLRTEKEETAGKVGKEKGRGHLDRDPRDLASGFSFGFKLRLKGIEKGDLLGLFLLLSFFILFSSKNLPDNWGLLEPFENSCVPTVSPLSLSSSSLLSLSLCFFLLLITDNRTIPFLSSFHSALQRDQGNGVASFFALWYTIYQGVNESARCCPLIRLYSE